MTNYAYWIHFGKRPMQDSSNEMTSLDLDEQAYLDAMGHVEQMKEIIHEVHYHAMELDFSSVY